MGLKSNRHEAVTDLSFYMNTTGTRGLFLVHDTAGSGISMDQAQAVVATASGASTANATSNVSGTRPAGLLLNDVVNLDLTRQHLNHHKDEVQLGSKVLLMRQGWVVTDNVEGTPAAGSHHEAMCGDVPAFRLGGG